MAAQAPEPVQAANPADRLDLRRYAEIIRLADLGENLWASLRLAAERGDNATIRLNCQQIQLTTKSTFHLAKRLGNDDPADG